MFTADSSLQSPSRARKKSGWMPYSAGSSEAHDDVYHLPAAPDSWLFDQILVKLWSSRLDIWKKSSSKRRVLARASVSLTPRLEVPTSSSGDCVSIDAFSGRRRTRANGGAPGGIRTPDTQFRSLVVNGVAACSLLFVNIHLWPAPARNPARATMATEREYRRMTKKDTKRMY